MTDKQYNNMRDSLIDAVTLIRRHADTLDDANDAKCQEHWFNIKDSIDEALDKLDGFKAAMLK